MKYTELYKITLEKQLDKLPTHPEEIFDEAVYKKKFKKLIKKLSKIQDKMYAHNKYSVLICLQGMDTAGKDSMIREVFKEFNVRGVNVSSFKTPSSFELEHDYMWRHYLALPEKGKFAVFNRTHYENLLVTRVHPSYILNENIPRINSVEDITEEFWENRFESINDFEKHWSRNGTIILKFYLHLGKEEQRQRLLRRLEQEEHNWKFSVGDLKERNLWSDYQKYYQEILDKTSFDHAPWFVIPADHKEMARYCVAKIILEKLETLTDIKEPELEENVQKDLQKYRDILRNES